MIVGCISHRGKRGKRRREEGETGKLRQAMIAKKIVGNKLLLLVDPYDGGGRMGGAGRRERRLATLHALTLQTGADRGRSEDLEATKQLYKYYSGRSSPIIIISHRARSGKNRTEGVTKSRKRQDPDI